jgi:hypothetical protein
LPKKWHPNSQKRLSNKFGTSARNRCTGTCFSFTLKLELPADQPAETLDTFKPYIDTENETSLPPQYWCTTKIHDEDPPTLHSTEAPDSAQNTPPPSPTPCQGWRTTQSSWLPL